MHRATHHKFPGENFVKKDVFSEGTKNEKVAPFAQSRVRKPAGRTKKGMLAEQLTGGFDSIEIAIRHFQTGFTGVPFKLLLHVSDEITRPAEVHEFFRTGGARSPAPECL